MKNNDVLISLKSFVCLAMYTVQKPFFKCVKSGKKLFKYTAKAGQI